MHAKYEVSISYGSKVMDNVKVFRYVGQRSRSRSLGQNFWHGPKGLIRRNVHVKYENSSCNGLKVTTKVNLLKSRLKVTVKVTRSLTFESFKRVSLA